MMRKFFFSLGLKDSWNYKTNRSLLLVNIVLGALALYAGAIHYISRVPSVPPASPKALQIVESLPTQTLIEKFDGQIQKNMTLSDVLSEYNLHPELIQQLVVVTKPIYNLKKLIVGNRFELEKLPDGTLKTFSYTVDLEKYLHVSLTQEGYKAELKPIQYETRSEMIAGTIHSSLFRTLNEMEEGDQLAVDMAEILSWDIDFSTELQPKDHFKVAVEKLYKDGEFVKNGKILAVEFSNKGRVFSGYRFTDHDGHSDYYDAQGRSLKRDFLKSPIKFSRISSKFSGRRFHPLLKAFRPHLGIDYSAPTGTPVISAGNGRVQFVGWKNGYGRSIEVNHGNQLITMYGHLSHFAAGIRAGSSVKQGDVIGYVGATGLATGPHLDYRVTRKGVFVNPLSIKFQPSTPVKPEYLAEFQVKKLEWQTQLAQFFPSQDRLRSSVASSSRKSR